MEEWVPLNEEHYMFFILSECRERTRAFTFVTINVRKDFLDLTEHQEYSSKNDSAYIGMM